LLSPIPVGCFFLDTTTILSEILKENMPRIDKFKKDVETNGISCYISDSVESECREKIQNTTDFLGNIIRESIKTALEESRKKRKILTTVPITHEDIIALEELFSALHGTARQILRETPLLSPVRIVEEWVVTFLGEKLQQRVTIDEFLVELVKKLLALTSSLQDSYDELVTYERRFAKKINISVDTRITNSLKNIEIHEPDATHIASAFSHQTTSKEKTVFVSLDYASIIRKQTEIKKQLNIVCCDPLYAIHHLI